MNGVADLGPRLLTDDGVALQMRVWAPDPPEQDVAVVLAHGFSASSAHPDVIAAACELTGRGYHVVGYDARGHGASGGLSTLGDDERLDVAAACGLARKTHTRIVLVGASMGAIAVLRHAAVDAAIAGAVVLSCPARWRLPRSATGLAAVALTRTAPGRWVARRHVGVRVAPRWTNAAPPVELAPRLGMPVAVLHGERDRFIGVEHARELHASLGAPGRLTVVPGHGHAFGPTAFGPLADAVDWIVGQASPPVTTAPGTDALRTS